MGWPNGVEVKAFNLPHGNCLLRQWSTLQLQDKKLKVLKKTSACESAYILSAGCLQQVVAITHDCAGACMVVCIRLLICSVCAHLTSRGVHIWNSWLLHNVYMPTHDQFLKIDVLPFCSGKCNSLFSPWYTCVRMYNWETSVVYTVCGASVLYVFGILYNI